jgi:hypothetical protein
MKTRQENETKGIVPILKVPVDIYDWLKNKADAKGVDIGQVVADLIAEKAEEEAKP